MFNVLDREDLLHCSYCLSDEDTESLMVCGRCKKYGNVVPAVYCSRSCQEKHWPTHKRLCKVTPIEVINARKRNSGVDWCQKWRACMDGSLHFGDLELITWDGYDVDDEEKTDLLGWGAVFKEEEHLIKEQFETEFKGKKYKLLKYRYAAFRWTCCGMSHEGLSGCDHHGSPEASQPCKCDFCKMGKPLPNKLIEKRNNSQAAQGLNLLSGPDPRSYDPVQAAISETMRNLLGLDL